MGNLSIWHWIIVLLLLGAIFAPIFFYVRTYREVARAINAKGGNAPVEAAWLLFIPVFNGIWFFVLLVQLKEALKKARIETQDESWWIFGLAAGILNIICAIGGLIVPIFAWASLASLAFGIVHWVKLAGLKTAISQVPLKQHATTDDGNVIAKLAELQQLLNDGVITPEEFQRLKQKLI